MNSSKFVDLVHAKLRSDRLAREIEDRQRQMIASDRQYDALAVEVAAMLRKQKTAVRVQTNDPDDLTRYVSHTFAVSLQGDEVAIDQLVELWSLPDDGSDQPSRTTVDIPGGGTLALERTPCGIAVADPTEWPTFTTNGKEES